ncbi:hypothetical protein DFH07DRAFT_766245 [Mycena maculata]|uniref:Uncharacterized protein n=1 Tax=Mycena maculata TaxID=230809 RepID=A0AAD7K6V5_9AGAR|nr:hypothetical protein DFH07DRAFT_766245 [Mycena maculata]
MTQHASASLLRQNPFAPGKEHDQISHFLLEIIVDIRLPDNLSPVRLLGAVRGILDFVYLAQYPMHTDETLSLLEDVLDRFHENKSISMGRWITTTPNTPSGWPLHIDLAKDAYRSTNFKDEFPQMTLWLKRKEKIFRHEKFIQWKLDGSPAPTSIEPLYPGIIYEHQLVMTKHPTVKSVKIAHLIRAYQATFFREALSQFIVHFSDPTLPLAKSNCNHITSIFPSTPFQFFAASNSPHLILIPRGVQRIL